MNPLLFIGGFGGWEVLLIMAIILLLFGAKKIPELARGIGSGIREFKSASVASHDEEIPTQDSPTASQVVAPVEVAQPK